jgi:CubicO group peptidase (beta-lactamase class C family)
VAGPLAAGAPDRVVSPPARRACAAAEPRGDLARRRPRAVIDPSPIVEVFRAQHAAGRFPGGQLVVRWRGEAIVDEAVGLASGHRAGEPRVEVTPETRFQVFSASKPVVALAAALLEERGHLDVHAPLARFVPSWTPARTVLDVLTHRVGILLPGWVADEARWDDRDGIVRAIAATPPRWRRGALAYAPYEFGWMLREVIERVAGEPLPAFVHRELLAPAGVDAAFTTSSPLARSYWLGGPRVVAGHELSARWEAVHNAPRTPTVVCPGAGLIASARALARLYELLLDGGRGLLRPETIAASTRCHVARFDHSNRVPLRVARGFLLGATLPSAYGWSRTRRCFGHAGAFSTLAWADPDRAAAIAYVTNGNRGPFDLLARGAALGAAVRRALPAA